jgi:phage tail sheath protein FI
MPTTFTYPGVYVEEIPSGVRTIVGVSTSDTAFVDFFPRGPMERPVRITGMEDFNRRFGGLHPDSEASYALAQYFLNGGQIAWVVRVSGGPELSPAELAFGGGGGSPASARLVLEAANPGGWGKNLQAAIDHQTRDPSNTHEFNLVVRELDDADTPKAVVASEIHRNLSTETTSARNAKAVVNQESALVRVTSIGAGPRPPESHAGVGVTGSDVIGDVDDEADVFTTFGAPAGGGEVTDGLVPDRDAFTRGFAALQALAPEIFNILCIPAASNLDQGTHAAVVADAAKLCRDKRAFLIVDLPSDVDTLDGLEAWVADHGDNLRTKDAAVYFPRIEIADPLNENRPREVGPSGTLAGIYGRTDATRGVWKAPAGTDARLSGVTLTQTLTDPENGGLNPRGINVLRSFPIFGTVAWGARTLDGADQQASEWKYIPVRRTALFIEESLYQALKWVVFEPNDEPLWAQIRLNVGAFMHDLFRQGAFQGATPQRAYFVKCDAATTTQTDIDKGIVNILVGFAPLKPAEFVVIRIQQIAGQIET